MLGLDLPAMNRSITTTPLYRVGGRLRSVTGRMTCNLPAAVGDHCAILPPDGDEVLAEVIGFENNLAYLVPFDAPENLRPGMPVVRKGRGLTVPTGANLLGRVIDGLGRPLDDLGRSTAAPAGRSTGPPRRRWTASASASRSSPASGPSTRC